MLFQTLQHDSTVYFSFGKGEKRRGGEGKGKGGERRGEKKRNPEQQKIDSNPHERMGNQSYQYHSALEK